MLKEYLKNLNINFRDKILNICSVNSNLELFLLNCSKINLQIFENDRVNEKEIILKKIKNLKEYSIKTFGMKIFKKYYNCENSIKIIEKNFNKLKNKFLIIDDIFNFLSKYSNSNFLDIFDDINNNLKINYSIKPFEVIEFDIDLFINSDDLESDSEIKKKNSNSIFYDINNKSKYIDEYSNYS